MTLLVCKTYVFLASVQIYFYLLLSEQSGALYGCDKTKLYENYEILSTKLYYVSKPTGMWHSDDQMFDDEVVSDGTRSKDRLSFPSPDSSKPFNSGGTSSQHLMNKSSQLISKNTDSGFLSGVSISDSVSDIDCSQQGISTTQHQQPSEMKIESASRYSDSGLSLDYSHSDLQSNNLSSPTKIQNDNQTRRITLHDLLRQDDDGDT